MLNRHIKEAKELTTIISPWFEKIHNCQDFRCSPLYHINHLICHRKHRGHPSGDINRFRLPGFTEKFSMSKNAHQQNLGPSHSFSLLSLYLAITICKYISFSDEHPSHSDKPWLSSLLLAQRFSELCLLFQEWRFLLSPLKTCIWGSDLSVFNSSLFTWPTSGQQPALRED